MLSTSGIILLNPFSFLRYDCSIGLPLHSHATAMLEVKSVQKNTVIMGGWWHFQNFQNIDDVILTSSLRDKKLGHIFGLHLEPVLSRPAAASVLSSPIDSFKNIDYGPEHAMGL